MAKKLNICLNGGSGGDCVANDCGPSRQNEKFDSQRSAPVVFRLVSTEGLSFSALSKSATSSLSSLSASSALLAFWASIRWLVARVFEDPKDVPDKLRDGVQRDENGHLQISEAVIGALCKGFLYSQAAAKIFKEPNLVTKSHGAVLAALTDYGVDVTHRPEDGGSAIEESQLSSANPFNISAHLSLIDALMMAHLRNVITVERVVDAVSRHTCVEPNMDQMMIPEMEDLYDDISDGQCLCALVHWYRPQEMPIGDISFNESAMTRDCQYNLMLLQHFCRHHLLSNSFHFEIEDLLYLRDSLQMNVNVFLADLFVYFEPNVTPTPVVETPRLGLSPRRFVPASAIPDLRAANAAARNAPLPRNRRPFAPPTQGPSRSTSIMSQDSLFAPRPQSMAMQRHNTDHDANITNFEMLQHEMANSPNFGQSAYGRSDSMPAASIRLAMEAKRRSHEKQRAMYNTASESERAEKSKAAFFALLNREEMPADTNDGDALARIEQKLRDLEMKVMDSGRLNRALSQPSVVQAAANGSNYGTLPSDGYMTLPVGSNQMTQSFVQHPQAPFEYYPVNHQQPSNYATPNTQMRSSLSNGMLNHTGYVLPPMYQAEYGGMPGQAPMGYGEGYGYHLQHPQLGQVPQGYNTIATSSPLSYNGMGGVGGVPGYHESPQMSAMSVHPPSNPLLAAQQPPLYGGNHPSMDVPHYENPANTFHLHNDEGAANQIDPPLEINRNLTNWGMTYKQDNGRNQRRTWQNETFIKNELDLVNLPDHVPHVTDETSTQPEEARKLQEITTSELISRETVSTYNTMPPNAYSKSNENNEATTPPSFVVAAEEAATDNFDKIANERRIARKAALIAKTMKRKEEIENKVDMAEQKIAERKMLENAKKEVAQRRKLEKEIQRQKILDDYKKKKIEKELGVDLPSARSSSRGHSQPPFTSGIQSARLRGQSSVEQRVTVSSLNEPTHKLFGKPVTKSNRGLIINALQFSVFPGAVNNATRNATMEQLAASSSKHFLILFRDQKCQYRGLYTWDEISDTAVKISGQGPPKCTEAMMNMMFKYDSGAKSFTQIATKHLSATIDGFAIQDQYWQRARIPHSGTATHRNN
ncbi:unnamed protein product [Caenorhabditis auriculariae]|uniref:Uncharacterized protein n=1 Tax=Caenorhabditis auriculariae TaxID=2777116 RepID=A0A8S1H0Y2_9PELO|nr:unnamed protein product [Caenorhabditis auriculariae]